MSANKFISYMPLGPEYEQMTESQTFIRVIPGKITKERYKVIARYIRRLTWSGHCGCLHDCCGCVSTQYAWLTKVNGSFAILLNRYYNY